MHTLRVQVAPANPGTVTVKVWSYTRPGPNFSWTGQASQQQPLDQSWNEMQPGHYAVTFSWPSGYQNISGATANNDVIVNGQALYYQVLGKPSDANGISATFGFQV